MNISNHRMGYRSGFLLAAVAWLVTTPAWAASTTVRVLPANANAPLVIEARPDSSVVAWAVEESLPAGVVAVEISHGGRFDPFTNKVKWGPYLDVIHRDLAFRLVSSGSGEITVTGGVSWDGQAAESIAGEGSLTLQTGGFTSWLLQTFGAEILGRPDGSPGYDGDGDQIPLLAEYYFGLDPSMQDQPGMRLSIVSPDNLQLVLTRRAAASTLEAGFYASQNLANWTPFDPGTPVSQTASGDLETLTFDLGFVPSVNYIRLHLAE